MFADLQDGSGSLGLSGGRKQAVCGFALLAATLTLLAVGLSGYLAFGSKTQASASGRPRICVVRRRT